MPRAHCPPRRRPPLLGYRVLVKRLCLRHRPRGRRRARRAALIDASPARRPWRDGRPRRCQRRGQVHLRRPPPAPLSTTPLLLPAVIPCGVGSARVEKSGPPRPHRPRCAAPAQPALFNDTRRKHPRRPFPPPPTPRSSRRAPRPHPRLPIVSLPGWIRHPRGRARAPASGGRQRVAIARASKTPRFSPRRRPPPRSIRVRCRRLLRESSCAAG